MWKFKSATLERVRDNASRSSRVQAEMAAIHGDFAGQSMRIDRIEGRFDRIEQRLDLRDA
jgi:hypothetical protein